MNKILVRILTACGLAALFGAVPISTAPSAFAATGCINGYSEIGAWDLKGPGGDKRPDIGGLVLSEKEVSGPNLFCVTTESGSKTEGERKPMMAMIGWYNPDTGLHYLPMSEGDMYDAGNYASFAGPVFTKVPDGQCLAFKGSIKYNDKQFDRVVDTSRCY